MAPKIELLEMIGSGGYGSVFLAEVTRGALTQRRAVKVLHGELASEAGRQRDEGRMLGQLNHDGIVKLIELTEIEGIPALIMEYVEGVDLNVVADQRHRMSLRACLEVAEQAASALNAAWATTNRQTGRPLCLIHRDIKPGNLMLTVSGQVKMLDFGVARADIDREGRTATQLRLGTVRYMAPEHQLNNEVSHKTDIYALGLTLAQLIRGKQARRLPLNEGNHHRFVSAIVASVSEPHAHQPFLGELGALLASMLDWDPERRPTAQRVEVQALELADTIGGESLRAFAKRVVPDLVSLTHRKVPPNVLQTLTGHRRRVVSQAVLTGSVVALVVAAGAVVWAWLPR